MQSKESPVTYARWPGQLHRSIFETAHISLPLLGRNGITEKKSPIPPFPPNESFYSQLDSAVIYWSQYFEIIFHFLDRPIAAKQYPNDHVHLPKRIPNWKSIRRMDTECWMGEIFSVVGCIVLRIATVYNTQTQTHTIPTSRNDDFAAHLGFGQKTRKYFTIYKSLFNLEQLTATASASTINTIFQCLSSWKATTLLRCELYTFVFGCFVRMENEWKMEEWVWERERKTFAN